MTARAGRAAGASSWTRRGRPGPPGWSPLRSSSTTESAGSLRSGRTPRPRPLPRRGPGPARHRADAEGRPRARGRALRRPRARLSGDARDAAASRSSAPTSRCSRRRAGGPRSRSGASSSCRLHAHLKHSRAHLWRYPAGATGRLHREHFAGGGLRRRRRDTGGDARRPTGRATTRRRDARRRRARHAAQVVQRQRRRRADLRLRGARPVAGRAHRSLTRASGRARDERHTPARLTRPSVRNGSRVASVRVAVAQIEPALGENERNLEVCLGRLEEAAAAGAELLVLPECAIPGYMFDSAAEALPFAEEIPGPSTEALAARAARLGVHVVCGLLERDGDRPLQRGRLRRPGRADRQLPQDAPAVSRRRPLHRARRRAPRLRHAARPRRDRDLLRPPLPGGDADARAGRCRHRRAPDRVPRRRTDPDRADHGRARRREPDLPAHREPCREGAERPSSAAGARSSIRTASGSPRPDATEEALLVADIDVESARDKDYVIPGEYEMYLFGDRRPELYGALVEERQPAAT